MIANDFQKITELLQALFTFDGDELKVKTTGVEFTGDNLSIDLTSTNTKIDTTNTKVDLTTAEVAKLTALIATGALKVSLPVATVSTLTPPAAITNYLQETGGNADALVSAFTTLQAKIPALGQALAAASIPVVLTAAQITSLQTVTEANSAAIKADLDLITAYTKPYLLVNGFSGTGNGSAQTISLAGNRIEISNNPLNAAALTVGVNSKTVYVLPGESKIITTAAFSTFTVTCESNGTYTGLVESNA